jgi:DNA-binding IclR family transcriptional regulator
VPYAALSVYVRKVHTKGPQLLVSYERGRPMPLFRGATSRIMGAYVIQAGAREIEAALKS